MSLQREFAYTPTECTHRKYEMCIQIAIKDGDKKCMDNYRPISVLPVASKILETAVQIQLLQHLDKSIQLSPFQCGFQKNHSTQDAVIYFTDCIDEGCVAAEVFVEFFFFFF